MLKWWVGKVANTRNPDSFDYYFTAIATFLGLIAAGLVIGGVIVFVL